MKKAGEPFHRDNLISVLEQRVFLRLTRSTSFCAVMDF